MRRIRAKLTYSNVTSTIALFLVLAGGTAFAASKVLPKNSVGTNQLKKGAVTAAKLKAGAITGAKVKNGSLTGADIGDGSVGSSKLQDASVGGSKLTDAAVTGTKLADNAVSGGKLQDASVTGAKVKDGSLTGADIDQATLTGVRASNVTGLAFTGDATCSAATPLPTGVSSERPGTGRCLITFPDSVINCAATVSPHVRASGLVILVHRTAEIIQFTASPTKLEVATTGEGSAQNEPFDLVLVC